MVDSKLKKILKYNINILSNFEDVLRDFFSKLGLKSSIWHLFQLDHEDNVRNPKTKRQ